LRRDFIIHIEGEGAFDEMIPWTSYIIKNRDNATNISQSHTMLQVNTGLKNTDIIFDTYINLKQLHAKDILYNLYYFNHRDISYNHNYSRYTPKGEKYFLTS